MEPSQSQPLSYAKVSDPSQDLSPSLASRDLFETSTQSRKRPLSSPAKSDNPKPKQQRASSVTAKDLNGTGQTTNCIHEIAAQVIQTRLFVQYKSNFEMLSTHF